MAQSGGTTPSSQPMPKKRYRRKNPITPLDIFTRVMQGDDTITDRQFDAAKVAAPYLHPKLSGLSMNAVVRKGLDEYSDKELAALAHSGQHSSPD